jgi:hypothetical protein
MRIVLVILTRDQFTPFLLWKAIDLVRRSVSPTHQVHIGAWIRLQLPFLNWLDKETHWCASRGSVSPKSAFRATVSQNPDFLGDRARASTVGKTACVVARTGKRKEDIFSLTPSPFRPEARHFLTVG